MSSLLGLHFSQDLLSLCAATQHLCLHSLPSALAFSQQVCFLSVSAPMAVPARIATAQANALRVLMSFIVLLVTITVSVRFPRIASSLTGYPTGRPKDWIG